ncbi:hypothetical protein [Streptomyces sp. NBC_01233]|nr:hypothetical protein OG332_10660 [Streptomyces sp. NBC_01233]
MALRKTMPMAPETRPDPKHATDYQASRGGHMQTSPKPVPGTRKEG